MLVIADSTTTNASQQLTEANSTSATNGVTVAGGNGTGSALDQLNHPAAVYVDHYENLYIADQNNDRILKYASGINGIAQVAANANLLVYPNPNTGTFTLQFSDDAEKQIEITDVTGRPVQSTTTGQKQMQFSLGAVAPGIYFLRIAQPGRGRGGSFDDAKS